MNWLMRLATAAAALFGAALAANANTGEAAGDARRVALVLGNAKYEHATELANPVNDAKAISAKLRAMGFDVIEGVNSDVDRTYELIEEFGVKATGAYMAAVFYAGHGIQVNGENYILPVDAKLEGSTSLKREAVAINDIIAEMENRARVKIVILDACRDNPLSRSFQRAAQGTRSVVSGGLAPLDASGGGDGTFIVFATQPGNVASDGAGEHSPFSQALLTHIDAPGVSITDMLTRVTGDVNAATGQKQKPWINYSATGVVSLNPTLAVDMPAVAEAPKPMEMAALPIAPEPAEVRAAAERTAGEAPGSEGVNTEEAELQEKLYDRAVQQNKVGAYESYLAVYPNGIYAGLARSAIEVLNNQAAVARNLNLAPQQQVAGLPRAPTSNALPAPGMVEPDVPAMLGRDDWRSVQRRLGWLGFDAGPADGMPGSRTYGALAAWQQAHSFTPDATLTVSQYSFLQSQTADRHAQWLADEQARQAAVRQQPQRTHSGGGRVVGDDFGRALGGAIGGAIANGILKRF